MTPSVAYYEFLQQLRANAINELDFAIKKADRSICPRRREFKLYKKKKLGRRIWRGKWEKKYSISLKSKLMATQM